MGIEKTIGQGLKKGNCCYIAQKIWQHSLVVTWKIGNITNKLDGLAKEISGQGVVESSTWVLPAAKNKMQQERDDLKTNFSFFK